MLGSRGLGAAVCVRLCLCVCLCVCLAGAGVGAGSPPLETQSIFYGVALTASHKSGTGACHQQLASLARGVAGRERWALKLLDASGVPAGGLYWGHTHWLGSRKQCSAAGSLKQVPVSPQVGPITEESPATLPPFPVAYYAAYFTHNSTMQVFIHWKNEMRITLGLCIPSSCSEKDVASLLQEYFDSNVLYQQYVYSTSLKMEGVKRTVDDFSWMKSFKFIIVTCLVSTFLVLCVLGTIYDLLVYQYLVKEKKKEYKNKKNAMLTEGAVEDSNSNIKEKDLNLDYIYMKKSKKITDNIDTSVLMKPKISLSYEIMLSFSIYTNSKLIFKIDKNKEKTLYPIHGIRFLTMVYVIVGHSVLYTTDHYDNRVSAFYISDIFIVQIFTNAILSIDTFFTLSGFLLAYLFLQLEDARKDKPARTLIQKSYFYIFGILKRFLRLTPAYMIVLGITDIISTWRYKSTAFWTTERNDIVCSKYWWRNILYINNFFSREEMCMSWSWYLSNDMQFFILCSFLLILSSSHLKTSMSIFALIFIGAASYTGYVVYDLDYIPFLDNQYEKLNILYDPPWTRIGPYIIGIAAAYIYFGLKRKFSAKKYVLYILWGFGIFLNAMTMFGLQDRNINLATSILYVSLGRSAWALGVAWIIFACLTENAGFVNKLLSLRLWIPLSRLTYCAYLINPVLIYIVASYNEKGWQVEVASTLVLGCGFVALSFVAAFVLSVMIEVPIIQITRIIQGEPKPCPPVDDVIRSADTAGRDHESKSF